MKTLVGVIPARGGSKGVPRKNVRTICGKPLIAWSIEAAQQCSYLDEFVVSTEDEEIASIARECGAKVLKRPSALASDEATTISVLQHVLDEIPSESLMVLQPTSPIRSTGLLNRCVEAYRQSGGDNLATGFDCKFCEFGSYDNMRRQDMKPFFYDDGNVYLIRHELVRAGRWSGDSITRFYTERAENYEIDDEVDFFIVEKLLERQLSV